MDPYLETVRGTLRRSADLHLLELISESGSKDKPLTMLLVDDLLKRMVAGGSSTDCLTLGVPDAIEKVEKEILAEGSRRYEMLIAQLRIEEKPEIWPYLTHSVNFPTSHFEKRFQKVN